MVWVNSGEHASPVGFVVLGVAIFMTGVVIRYVAIRYGLDAQGSTYAVAIFIIGFTNAGLLLDRGLNRFVLLIGLLLASAIAYRLRASSAFGLAILWGAMVVIAYPWLVWLTSGSEPGQLRIVDPDPLEATISGEIDDVVIVFLDGYANGEVLAEVYDYDIEPFSNQLIQLGFDVSSMVATNFGRTRFSVSSVVQLDYPVREGPLSGADLDHLLEIIGGDSIVADWLTRSGFRHTYVESGWFGTKCRSTVDECIVGPWPNESLYDFTNRTLLKDLPGLETGRSFSNGAQHAMHWLNGDLPELIRNGQHDLIYVHVLAPHPPLFLDSQCAMHAQEGFKGFTIAQPGMTESDLDAAREWYGKQVDCVNRVLKSIAEVIAGTDSVVLMLGDHGPDSLGQLFSPGAEWSEQQRFERMGAFVAAYVPGCDMSGIESLVNVGRRLVSCISDIELVDLESKAYESEITSEGEQLVEIPLTNYRDSD